MYLLKLHILWKGTLKFTESFFLCLFVFHLCIMYFKVIKQNDIKTSKADSYMHLYRPSWHSLRCGFVKSTEEAQRQFKFRKWHDWKETWNWPNHLPLTESGPNSLTAGSTDRRIKQKKKSYTQGQQRHCCAASAGT